MIWHSHIPHNRWGSDITSCARHTTKAIIETYKVILHNLALSRTHLRIHPGYHEPLGSYVRKLSTGGVCDPQLKNCRLSVRSGFNSLGRVISYVSKYPNSHPHPTFLQTPTSSPSEPFMPEKLTWLKINPYVSVSCQPNTADGRIVVKDGDRSPSCVPVAASLVQYA